MCAFFFVRLHELQCFNACVLRDTMLFVSREKMFFHQTVINGKNREINLLNSIG